MWLGEMDILRIGVRLLIPHCLALLWPLGPVGSVAPMASAYHTFITTSDFLKRIEQENPDLTRVYSIGNSSQGRPLWVLEMTANFSQKDNPNIKFVSQIHGDAPLGREIILKLIEYLINNYRKGDRRVENIFNNLRIHFLPSLNPDGYEKSTEGICSFGSGRNNARGVDLNRNFPRPWGDPPGRVLEPETRALIEWMRGKGFLASATLTSGAHMIAYPYDDQHPGSSYEEGKESPTPDDDLFKRLSISYAHRNLHLAKNDCWRNKFPAAQKQVHNLKGIYNGAALSPIQGTMMDYNYHYCGCLEITIFMDCCKFPKGPVIEKIWNENREALLGFMEDLLGNVRISVRSQNLDNIIGAEVTMMGDRKEVPIPSANGFRWRLLPPKKRFYFKVAAKGYQQKIVDVQVPEERWKSGEATILNVVLEREPVPTTLGLEAVESQDYSSDDQVSTTTNQDNFTRQSMDFSTATRENLTPAVTWIYFNLESNSTPQVGSSNSSQYHCFLLLSERAFKITSSLLVLTTFLTIILILKQTRCFGKCFCKCT